MTDQKSSGPPACLLYDGQCPVCSAFAGLVAQSGPVVTIDARQASALRERATAGMIDLDEGVALEHAGTLYYGADALYHLARLAKRGGWAGLVYLPFRSRTVARLLYPSLVRLRRALLRISGKSLIRNLPPQV